MTLSYLVNFSTILNLRKFLNSVFKKKGKKGGDYILTIPESKSVEQILINQKTRVRMYVQLAR